MRVLILKCSNQVGQTPEKAVQTEHLYVHIYNTNHEER